METYADSQQQFQRLKATVKDKLPANRPELSRSFSAFCRWLAATDYEAMQQVNAIASDIRLWRDSQDVLRQLWEQIYRH